jgi:hypothetical protein
MPNPSRTSSEESLRLQILRRTYELLTAALSFVAALAWNEAIQALFLQLFGPAQTLLAKFAYAAVLTVLIVWLGTRLAKVTGLIEKRIHPPTSL